MFKYNHPYLSGHIRRTDQFNTITTPTPRIGIALSGGVVRGFVHIGVLKALEEEKIPISFVGGASAGALIGYFFAAGLKSSHLITMSKYLQWFKFIRPTLHRQGFFTFKAMEKWLINWMDDLTFAEMVRPFVVVATDIQRGEQVQIKAGPVAPAIHASCAVPGLIKPVDINGQQLVDGGVVNNLPVDAVRSMGADYVIGVDVFDPNPHRWLGPFGVALSAAEIMVRNTNNGRQMADCLIAPNLQRFAFHRFRDKERLIAAGYASTKEKMPEIKAYLRTAIGVKSPTDRALNPLMTSIV